jgi:hypothetical protein
VRCPIPGSNTYKITWGFTEANGATFSEIYYTTASNPSQATLVDANGSASRLALLDPSCTWRTVRAADVNNARSTAQRVVNWVGTAKNSIGPAAAGTAMVCQLVGVNGGSRKLWMRGIPAYFVTRNDESGRDYFVPAITNPFQAMIKGNANFGYGMRSLTQTQKYTIASVDGTVAPGFATITFNPLPPAAAPIFQNPSRVVIGSADRKTLPGLNGHWTVLNGLNAGGSVVIRYQVAGNAKITLNCGTIKQEGYGGVSVFNPQQCQPAYWGTHTTRNPISNSRGARRAQRIRSLV